MYKSFFKRVLDFIAASILLVVVAPLLLVVSLILWISLRGSPFFYQDRPGIHERRIKIIKFKSMKDTRDASGKLLPDNERITIIGRFIRKLSIDELPQLINVIKGDMSLIGPRPLLFKYIPLYSAEQKRRHEVRPGITGWAQVNGRNNISWTNRFNLDVYYVDHVNIWFDLKILALTIVKVLKREGINQSSDRPMQPFDGTN